MISIGDLKFVISWGTAEFSSEIAKALNFTAEHMKTENAKAQKNRK